MSSSILSVTIALGEGTRLVSRRGMEWWKRRQKLLTSDIAEAFVSVTDVKHYVFCPRIIYFEKVLHELPQLGSQQEESGDLHEEFVKMELRRKGAVYYSPEFVKAEKILFCSLSSARLGLQGSIDCIIKTGAGEYVPVDYKNMPSNRCRAWADHKYQLTAYALLIDEAYQTCVRRGYISYIPEKLVVRLDITPTMKIYVKRVLGHIRSILTEEKLPPIRVSKQKCTGGCGHKQVCRYSLE